MARNVDRTPSRPSVAPALVLAVSLFLWASLLTFDMGDWPSANQFPHNEPAVNVCGAAGAWCAYALRNLLGDGAFPLVLFSTLAAILKLVQGRIGFLGERVFGLILVVAGTAAASHLVLGQSSGTMPVGRGGMAGLALGQLLKDNLSSLGTALVLVASSFVGLIFTTQGWVLRVPRIVGHAASVSANAASVARSFVAARAHPVLQAAVAATAPPRPAGATSARAIESPTRKEPTLFDPPTEKHAAKNLRADGGVKDREPQPAPAQAPAKPRDTAPTSVPAVSIPQKPPTPKPTSAGPIVHFPSPQKTAAAEPYPRHVENWVLPAVTLLREPEYGFNAQQEQVVRKQAKVLEETLQEFRIDASVVEIDTGPVITMFELRLGAGIKVSQIATLSNDIARALKAHAIRVVAPISGKNTIGIEVPNVEKERVRLKELMTLSGKRASEMALPLFLGKDAGGAALVTDLTAMPHMLIAGTTGSGKSVCLSAIILSFLMTKRPDHLKLILIDPKMVEMSQFKEIPHLMCPLVTDMARAEKILEWAVTQMDERYELLAEACVKNIAGYNALTPDELYARFKPESEQEKTQIPTRLPYIVIVIDELADLMMTAAKEVEHHLSRLAQKSRAVGVHIIVATQRPEVKVVTGLIKSNLPARISFRVASRMDSRIVLDQNGGEVLMGQGDMLFLPPGSHKLVRAQGTYLEDDEVRAVLEDLASRSKPDFHPELIRLKGNDAEVDEGMRDPLFDEAVRMIIETKRGSVSLLQRRLNVGYSRASRLIDQMAAAGIVGEYKGSQAREVLIALDEWNELRVLRDADDARQADEAARPVAAADRWYDSTNPGSV